MDNDFRRAFREEMADFREGLPRCGANVRGHINRESCNEAFRETKTDYHKNLGRRNINEQKLQQI